MDAWIVAGLGNPGRRYRWTRHNVGFMVLEELARIHGGRFSEHEVGGYLAEVSIGGTRVYLLAPSTYMNNSGEAVIALVREAEVPLERLLVVLDDIALPLGRIRIRASGSEGGHNGLRSVLRECGTEDIPRMRCGIAPPAPPPPELLAEFVLSGFEESELDAVRAMIVRGADAVATVAGKGLAAAMNLFNT